MRAFIAIALPETIKEALETLSGRLRASGVRASWVKSENMHLTLRFLDEIEPDAATRIGAILEEVYHGREPFPLHVQGTGAFPNFRKPSVIWVGAGPEEGPLAEVQSAAEQAARAIGVPPEKRKFSAHLTLARIRDPKQAGPLRSCVERERDFDAGEFTVRAVSLFSSQLTPQGPIYRHLKECLF